MNIQKYKNCLESISASDELKGQTINLMNNADTAAVKKRRISKIWAYAIAAVLAVSLVGIGTYAYNSGWIEFFFGESADKLLSDDADYSVELENIEIRCDDPDYSFEITSAYNFDEFLFYELDVHRTDGTPIKLPDGFDAVSSGGGFSRENMGENFDLKSGNWGQHASNIMGATDDGGITVLCDIYSVNGFASGDHIHFVLEQLLTFRPVHIFTWATVEIEFDISKLPDSNKQFIEVNKTAGFDDGYSCKINRISLSPMCITVNASAFGGETLEEHRLNDNKIVLKNGEVIENCGINHDKIGTEMEIFLFWESIIGPRFIMPDEIAEVHIGDLVIDCD
ncbi:MAG: hypothetical protein J6C96_05730 [Oscillospiraceae bacterium]|nr:hypothetical protein [Oscillospiraceae bacterium]